VLECVEPEVDLTGCVGMAVDGANPTFFAELRVVIHRGL
jgi:hypothetical protein